VPYCDVATAKFFSPDHPEKESLTMLEDPKAISLSGDI
jgi:hypothetical protein